MRIKVGSHNIEWAEALLRAATGCEVFQEYGKKTFGYQRQMLNPVKNTIVKTTDGGFQTRLQAVRAAAKQFGSEVREVLCLAPLVTAKDASISTCQRFVTVHFLGKKVDVFDNSTPSWPSRTHHAGPIEYEQHPLPRWPIVGAGIVMRAYRHLLTNPADVRDPLAITLSEIYSPRAARTQTSTNVHRSH